MTDIVMRRCECGVVAHTMDGTIRSRHTPLTAHDLSRDECMPYAVCPCGRLVSMSRCPYVDLNASFQHVSEVHMWVHQATTRADRFDRLMAVATRVVQRLYYWFKWQLFAALGHQPSSALRYPVRGLVYVSDADVSLDHLYGQVARSPELVNLVERATATAPLHRTWLFFAVHGNIRHAAFTCEPCDLSVDDAAAVVSVYPSTLCADDQARVFAWLTQLANAAATLT